jgi:aldehyde dehydrogenase (NAD+)
MNSTTKSQMATLQATANTRQCHNAFFRRHQLKCLHDTFRASSSEIISAIKKNTNVSQAEATTEFALALDIIKDHYNSINTTNELEYENRVAQGKDAADRRAPWGVVYIEPDLTHTPFFSVVVTLSAAVAAGNCVALKVGVPVPKSITKTNISDTKLL